MKIAALISGSGAFARVAFANRDRLSPAELALVICDRQNPAYEFFSVETDIPTFRVDYDSPSGRDGAENEIVALCRVHSVETLFLTYKRLVGDVVLDAFPGHVFNLHPALLPMFPGLHGIRDAYRHGTLFAGATVHQVDAGVDTGPIASQVVVACEPRETEKAFTHRIFQHGAALYVDTMHKVARGMHRTDGARVVFDGARYGTLPFNPALDIALESICFPQEQP